MEIKSIKTLMLSIPLRKPVTFATRTVHRRQFSVVQVFTDEETYGIGCVPIGDPLAVTGIIERKLKSLVVGENPFSTEKIWEEMYREMYRDRKGAAIRAISALDIALWDIKGKALKMPLYKLLGGYRDKVPCYASGGYYREGKGLKGLEKEMVRYVEQGFTAVKMKVGAVSLKKDVERVKVARDAIGPDIDLMIDANNAYDTHTAIKAGRMFEKYDIYWLEEPVWPDNIKGSAEVAAALDTPVASGELEYLRYGFRELIENRAVDIIQPDATVVGGITEWIKVAAMASAWNIPVAPHWEQEIHMHLAAAVPSAFTVELFVKGGDIRLEDKIYKGYVEPEKGYLKVPNKSGLGIELDPDAIKKYQLK